MMGLQSPRHPTLARAIIALHCVSSVRFDADRIDDGLDRSRKRYDSELQLVETPVPTPFEFAGSSA